MVARLAALWSYRELLVGMIRRELKVRYKNSSLGFAWSLLNPLMYLVIFYVAFQVILQAGIPSFPIFLLSGLLVWNLWLAGLSGATGAVVGNAGLVQKVSFPREILPLAAVGSAFVHFVLQTGVFAIVLALVRWDVAWAWLPLLVPAAAVLLVFVVGAGLLLSALNVRLRDTSHFLELVLLAWFWVTPIVYGFMVVGELDNWKTKLFMLNPLTPIVLVFQRAIYNTLEFGDGKTIDGAGGALGRLTPATQILPDWSMGEYGSYLAGVGIVAAVMLVFGFWVFGRLESSFAEEL